MASLVYLKHFFPHYAKSMHGKDHASKGGMIMQIKELWFTKGLKNVCRKFFEKDLSFVIMWQEA